MRPSIGDCAESHMKYDCCGSSQVRGILSERWGKMQPVSWVCVLIFGNSYSKALRLPNHPMAHMLTFRHALSRSIPVYQSYLPSAGGRVILHDSEYPSWTITRSPGRSALGYFDSG